MKKLAIILLSSTLLSSSGFAASDNVVATYKGGEVKESQVMSQFKSVLDTQAEFKGKNFKDLDPVLQERLVKAVVNMQLFNNEAKSKGIENSEEFKQKLEAFKNQLVPQLLIESYLKTAVTDSMIDKAYDDYKNSLTKQREIKIAHILVPTEKEALEVKKKLNKDSSNFASLAKQFSKDDSTKNSGGVIKSKEQVEDNGEVKIEEKEYIIKGGLPLPPAFEEKAFALKKKEVSEPILTQYGYHLIKVLEERPATIQPKNRVKDQLIAQLNREAIEKYLADLNTKAEVKLSLPTKTESKSAK